MLVKGAPGIMRPIIVIFVDACTIFRMSILKLFYLVIRKPLTRAFQYSVKSVEINVYCVIVQDFEPTHATFSDKI